MRRLLAALALSLLAVALVVAGAVGVVYGAYLDSQRACGDSYRLAADPAPASDGAGATAFDALNGTQRDLFADAREAPTGAPRWVRGAFPERVRYGGTVYSVRVRSPSCPDPGLAVKVAGFGALVLGVVAGFLAGVVWLRGR